MLRNRLEKQTISREKFGPIATSRHSPSSSGLTGSLSHQIVRGAARGRTMLACPSHVFASWCARLQVMSANLVQGLAFAGLASAGIMAICALTPPSPNPALAPFNTREQRLRSRGQFSARRADSHPSTVREFRGREQEDPETPVEQLLQAVSQAVGRSGLQ